MKKLGCKVTFNKENTGLRAQKYNYLTDIEDLKIGDVIVVHARDSFALAYFAGYDDTVEEKESTKWIVDKVDTSKHYHRIGQLEKARLLKEQLKKEAEKAKELELYEILAKNNPTIAILLEELKGLDI